MPRRQSAALNTLADVKRMLSTPTRGRGRRRAVVVLADRDAEVTALQTLPSRPRGQRTPRVLAVVAATDDQIHRRLAALDRLDLVVDVRGSGDGRQLHTFRRCFFHLNGDGTWVALRSSELAAGTEPMVALATRLSTRLTTGTAGDEWQAHARGSRRISVTPEAVLIGARPRHVLLLRDAELPLLSEREPALRVTTLASLPGGSVPVGPLLHDYGADPEPRVPDVLHYPPHTLRRYEGRLVLPRSTLVHHRRTVLPDSFRWHLKDELEVAGIRTIDEHFGRLRKGERGRRLDGSYFYFSYNNNGHYGHLMTEALSRLWGWWPAKAEDPSLRILCRLHPTRGDTAAERLETFLLPALGISPEDIVWVDGPVEVESLVGCTPMWHNAPPLYLHPAMLEVWDRLRTGVMREDAPPSPSRLFITRRVGGRPCSNIGEVEELFAAHGFTVVSPEQHSVPAQAALFAGARVVAGFGGSGMFNLAYAQAVETVIVLNQWAYRARNEHLFAAAHGAAMHCFWSRPDADHPEGGFSYDAHQGSWTFDTAGNGPPLRALLACLEH